MARGYPDHGVNTDALGQYGTDLAELAARLGSPYTILRSGKVIWYDTFENGLNSWKTFIPAGGALEIVTAIPFTGGYAMKFTDGTDAGALTYASKGIPLLQIGSYGFDTLVIWYHNTDNPLDVFLCGVHYKTRTTRYDAQIRIDPNTGEIKIYEYSGGAAAWTVIDAGEGTLHDVIDAYDYHYVHYTVDLVSLTYKLLIVDDREYDLTQYNLAPTAGAFVPGIQFFMGVLGAGNGQAAQVDNVIIMIDEQ